MSMSDSYTTVYHVDLWVDWKLEYYSMGEHATYEDAEKRYNAFCDQHPEHTWRIRSVDTAITHRVVRKNCGFDARKLEAKTA